MMRFQFGHPEIQARVMEQFEPLLRQSEPIYDCINRLDEVPQRVSNARFNIGTGMLVRGHASFSAILIVSGNGYGVDGLCVGRSIFEAAVATKYLAAHPDEIEDYWDFGRVIEWRHLSRLEEAMPGRVPPIDLCVNNATMPAGWGGQQDASQRIGGGAGSAAAACARVVAERDVVA